MKTVGTFALLIAALSLAGCAVTGTETMTKADADAQRVNDMPDNYRQLVAAELHKTLKDPYSIRDPEITQPLRTIKQGTSICVRLNAKNSYGGYTGQKSYTFFFHDKALSDFRLAGFIDGIGDTAEVDCKRALSGKWDEG